MAYSRRAFLTAMGTGMLASALPRSRALTGLAPDEPGGGRTAAPDEYPLARQVERFRSTPAGMLQATGLQRRDYLGLAHGIVRFFAVHQDERGAIIDPYSHKERQYATPAFACAAAVLT